MLEERSITIADRPMCCGAETHYKAAVCLVTIMFQQLRLKCQLGPFT